VDFGCKSYNEVGCVAVCAECALSSQIPPNPGELENLDAVDQKRRIAQ
jgi:hypothetical protein